MRPNTYARALTKWTSYYCLICYSRLWGTARSSHRNEDPDYQVWERRADVHHILSCHLHLASVICGGRIYDMYSTNCIFGDVSAGYGDCFILRHMLYINRIDERRIMIIFFDVNPNPKHIITNENSTFSYSPGVPHWLLGTHSSDVDSLGCENQGWIPHYS